MQSGIDAQFALILFTKGSLRVSNGLMILRMTNEFNLWPHPLASMSPVIRSLRDPL